MPGFDDRLTRELERAARPAAPDVVRTFEDVTRRRAHRAVVRKVQVVAVVVALLAGTAGAFVLLDERFDDRQPATSETIAPPVQQMAAWRLQWRPVIAVGTTGLNVACVAEGCSEDDLDPATGVALEGRDGQVYELGPAVADASNVLAAEARATDTDVEGPIWAVVIQLDEEGRAAFTRATERAWTAASPQNQIALVLDGAVIQAPTVLQPISDDSIQIGGLSEESAETLAAELTRGDVEVSPSEAPPPKGEDIGLGTNWCDVVRLGGLELVGEGTRSTVWTGYPVNVEGRCPRTHQHEVAVDVTGDGLPDASGAVPLVNCEYLGCFPLGATDLNADGIQEIVVIAAGAVINHAYLKLSIDGDEVAIEPILVAEPGNPDAEINPGHPLVTSAAGDEGFAGWIRCEDYPDDPILVSTWSSTIVDSDEPTDWHETKLELRDDGMFHVVAKTNLQLPQDEDPGFLRSEEPACGLDFRYW